MKALFSVLIVLAMVTPVFADLALVQENCEEAAPGTPLNTLGWTGADNIVISSSTIDQGQSADWASGSTVWPGLTMPINHTPIDGEVYTLSATLYSPQASPTDSLIALRSSGDIVNIVAGIEMGYGDLHFGIPNVATWFSIKPQPLVATDVKMVLSGTTADCYYRTNGTTDWTFAGEKTGIANSIAAYDTLFIGGHGGYPGGIDSMLLTTSVPEPSTLALLAAGLLSLAAYAWRKRR
jgi:hypothetical protein